MHCYEVHAPAPAKSMLPRNETLRRLFETSSDLSPSRFPSFPLSLSLAAPFCVTLPPPVGMSSKSDLSAVYERGPICLGRQGVTACLCLETHTRTCMAYTCAQTLAHAGSYTNKPSTTTHTTKTHVYAYKHAHVHAHTHTDTPTPRTHARTHEHA